MIIALTSDTLPPPMLYDAASTVLELSVPLALFSRRLRPLIVEGLLLFHATIWAFMNVPFPENMCLLALFSGTWFHRVAARLDRSAQDHGVPAST